MSDELRETNQEPDNLPPSPSGRLGMTQRRKVTILITVIVVVVAVGYFLNRYWIAPVTARQASSVTQAATDPGAFPMAPAFNVTDIFGRPLSLAQYRGKVVLLDFWATWCGPCRSEIPGFIQLQKNYAGQGFQIIGISEDQGGLAPVLDFYQQERINYRVAIDSDGKVGELYGGIIGLPTTFLIGRDGRIYSKLPGAVGADYFEPGIKSLLASSPGAEAKDFQPMEGSEPAQVETPAEVNSVVPGVDVHKLTKADLARYEEMLGKQKCTCGCQMSILQCRKTDPGCATSRQLAQDMLQKMGQAKHPI